MKGKGIGAALLIIILIGIPLINHFYSDKVTKWMEDNGYLAKYQEEYFAYLTDESMSCIANKCHGRGDEAETIEVETEWGIQKWHRIKSTYIGPHTEIKKLISFKYWGIPLTYAAEFESQSNHPVGIPYPIGDDEMWPIEGLKCTDIVLPFGYVECESCHNITPHGQIKCDDNKGSKLCLGCHNK